jgi:hypothetical protein
VTLQRTSQPDVKQPVRCALSRSARSMGIYVLAGRGTGKSRLLGRKIALEDFLAGFPQVIFDPVGATIDNFLDSVTGLLQYIPSDERCLFWDRITYVDMSGKDGLVVPFPLYYRLGTERSLLEIAERYLQIIIKSNPDLFHAQVLGWPPLHRIGVYSGIVLSALGYQITEAEDLLENPEAWEAAGRFAKAEQVSPEAKRAVAYFRNKYIPMREQDRSRLTTPFLDKIFALRLMKPFGQCLGRQNRESNGMRSPAMARRSFWISGGNRMKRCAGSKCCGRLITCIAGSKPGVEVITNPSALLLMNLPI